MAWEYFESTRRVSLPPDLKEIVSRYGAGDIDEFLRILSPIADDKTYRLDALMEGERERLLIFREFGDHSQALFPEPGGLLAWSVTLNGDTLFWRTNGRPEDWTIVVNPSRSLNFVEFSESTASFVLGLLTRRLHTDVFPDNFPAETPHFATVRECTIDRVVQQIKDAVDKRYRLLITRVITSDEFSTNVILDLLAGSKPVGEEVWGSVLATLNREILSLLAMFLETDEGRSFGLAIGEVFRAPGTPDSEFEPERQRYRAAYQRLAHRIAECARRVP
ncbi:MAG: hypothetical protein DWQ37_13395 [Planctomycetota bacterium]|nr:MAG: hypothetical protein DWQ37_13395 [Planctomycetota bacterium]